jgi:hypothetical protein
MRREALTVDPGGDLRGAPRDDTWQRWPGLVDDFDNSFIGGPGDGAHSEVVPQVDDLEALGNTSSHVTVASLEEYTSNASEAVRTWTKGRGKVCLKENFDDYSSSSEIDALGRKHVWQKDKAHFARDSTLGWRWLCQESRHGKWHTYSGCVEACKKICIAAGDCARITMINFNHRACFPSKRRYCDRRKYREAGAGPQWKYDTLAEMALKKATASLVKADKARLKSGKALKEADKALRKQKDQHKLVVAAQAKAQEAHRQARAAGSSSKRALKQAKTASGEAHNSLSKAQQAENHTETLRHVVDAQNHTMRTLNHTMEGLQSNVDRVDRMQFVDERLLNVTAKTTRHLELGRRQRRSTTCRSSTIAPMRQSTRLLRRCDTHSRRR